jgi:stearoyl-CoA desaturase (delta-9 desaturase)
MDPAMIEIERMKTPSHGADASAGRIVWDPVQSIWTLALAGIGAIGAAFTASLEGVLVFLVSSAVTIGLGHSIGMHRLLIHRSFKTPRVIEYLLVWLGVLVGMAGPVGMIRTHDLRDWAQRQRACHSFFAHGAPFWVDAWRQLNCRMELQQPPRFELEARVAEDPVYQFMERTWRWQQLGVAVIFFVMGGWTWVFWGVGLRVAVSQFGHFAVGHLAHNGGHQGWRVEAAAVQGFNWPIFAWITFGESWHANHHAFPGSARLGVEAGQCDPGWRVLQLLARAGLVSDLVTPQALARRPNLHRVDPVHSASPPPAAQASQGATHV